MAQPQQAYPGQMIDPRFANMAMQQPAYNQENFQLMVQNYESVLQSLNHEFKRALEQNKYLQEEMSALQQNQIKDRRIIEDMKLKLGEKDGNDHTQMLIDEKNEYKSECECKLLNLLRQSLPNSL